MVFLRSFGLSQRDTYGGPVSVFAVNSRISRFQMYSCLTKDLFVFTFPPNDIVNRTLHL